MCIKMVNRRTDNAMAKRKIPLLLRRPDYVKDVIALKNRINKNISI